MSEQLPCVCISVLNWNSYTHTIGCLESLQQVQYEHYKIIVVDNASQDDSVAHIRAAFPDVEIIEAASNLGYAGGNELALQQALADGKSDLFWILNNDTLVDPQAVTALVDAWRQYGDALYGGIPVEGQARRLKIRLNEIIFGGWFMRFDDLNGIPYADYFQMTQPRIVTSVLGSSLMLPLSVVHQHGFMDLSFFLYAEERDYCLRLAKKGIKSVLVPESIIYHTGGGSGKVNDGLTNIMRYYSTRNRLIFCRRHVSMVFYVYMIAVFLLASLKQKLIPSSNNPEGWHYYTLLGIRDSLLGRMGKTFAPEDWIT